VKPTGFMEFPPAAAAAAGPGPPARLARGLRALQRRVGPGAGGPLHGLRHPLLPRGLPAGQPDPRVERPRLPGRLAEAIERLHATNNFPEFTGRLCPAPCEAACVLGINDDPVTIERIEYEIVERAWSEGWVNPQVPDGATGKSVAVVGSGPAGLAAPSSWPGPATGGGVRAGREARGPAPLRHPRVQDGEGGARPAPGPDGGRGRRPSCAPPCRCRREHSRPTPSPTASSRARSGVGTACAPDVTVRPPLVRRVRRRRAGRRGHPAPRPAGTRTGAGRRPPGHGVPQAVQPGPEGRWATSPINAEGKHVVIIGGGDTGADCLGTSTARGRPRCTSSRSCPSPRATGWTTTRGPPGRSSCARRRPTRRAASGSSR
jgi:glutamate synthase (NADPH/NADH) small chain